MALFENYERRIDQITAVLNQYGIKDIEEAEKITKDAGLEVYDMVKGIQPICFENAAWAYTVGAAIAIKKGCRKASDAAAAIGEGLQAFCIPGSVADHRKVGLGHGNLGKMLLEEETECFCFLAGHESFAAAEGAIGIASKANVVREKPLRVILNGLGKDAAQIISRINGFTYVETKMDYFTGEVNVISETPYSDGVRASVKCYGADDVVEGVAIMHLENVGVSITGNSTNPTRFQHPVAGTYKKECNLQGKKYFSVASGGGTGRTLHPDNMAAGPASYGMTDTLGRMHSDAQFAGSSSVPAHVEMMGLIGMGNNPMVGATAAVADSVEEAAKPGKFEFCTFYLLDTKKGPCQNGESTILARPFFFFKLYCGKLALSVSFFAHCPRGVLLLWFSFAYLIVYSARDRREMRLELSTPGPTAHFAVYGGASRSCMPGSVKSTQLPLYTSLVA